MFATAISWLFNTKLGRSVLLVGTALITAGLLHWAFASHYIEQGRTACNNEWNEAVKTAVDTELKRRSDQATRASDNASKARADADKAVGEINDSNTKTVEVIRYVYRDRPTTRPVQPGGCVHPVDKRVQRRIEGAVDQARTASGDL